VNNSSPPKSRLEALRFGLRRLFGGRETPTAPTQFILGFAGLWFMVDEAHLANIAVREAYRHQGMGERLLIASIELAIEHDARFITLEVRASNKIAQALYRKYGLIEVGTRRGYYLDNKEDAVIMTAEGITSVPYVKSLQNLKQAHAQRWGLS
jgi:ribosomal-protein-alanine acetyltransferase